MFALFFFPDIARTSVFKNILFFAVAFGPESIIKEFPPSLHPSCQHHPDDLPSRYMRTDKIESIWFIAQILPHNT